MGKLPESPVSTPSQLVEPIRQSSPVGIPPEAVAELWGGIRGLLPLLIGVFPFGLIYGVLAIANGIPATAAMAMSSIVFAGSSQFMLSQLFALGAPGLVM